MTGVFNGLPLHQLQSMSPNNQDRRFKSLPPAESLPRNEPLGGYIFVCNNDTMEDDLRRRLFGLPQRYRDSVRAIQPGLPLFLYNYTTHQLHGVYEATSFGGSNLDPNAWEDKKSKGESRFPAQVRIKIRRQCSPLDEDHFRPILHHYDGPKFRLQLSVQETLNLLDLFDAVTASKPATPPSPRPPPSPTSVNPAGTPPAATSKGLYIRTPSAASSVNFAGTAPAPIRAPHFGRTSGPVSFAGSPPGAANRGLFIGSTSAATAAVSYAESPPLYAGGFSGPGFYTGSFPPAGNVSYAGTAPSYVSFSQSFPPYGTGGEKSFEVGSFARVMRPLSMV